MTHLAIQEALDGKVVQWMESRLHGRSAPPAVPGRQRTAAVETPLKQKETGKKPSPSGRRKGNNGSTAPEMRAP